MRARLLVFGVLLCLLVGVAQPVYAFTDLLVEPMMVETSDLKPGRKNTITIAVRNTNAENIANVQILLTGLGQGSNGAWKAIEETKESKVYSAIPWISLPANRLSLPPLTTENLELTITPPRKARGSYYAMLLIRSEPKAAPRQIPLVVQFAVPLLFSVKASSIPTKGAVLDAGFQVKDGKRTLACNVRNDSTIMAVAEGQGVLYKKINGRMRRVGQVAFKPKRVLPKQTLNLEAPLEDDILIGDVTLKARIKMGKRQLRPFEKLLSLSGDGEEKPALAVQIVPKALEVLARAGAKRSEVLQIINGDSKPVNVTFALRESPLYSQGENTHFSATQMITLSSATETVAPMHKKNIRITVARPKGEGNNPFQYSTIVAKVASQDGLHTFEQAIPLVVTDKEAQKTIEPAMLIEKPTLAQPAHSDNAAHPVTFVVKNTGERHVRTTLHAGVFDKSGKRLEQNLKLTQEELFLLPRESVKLDTTVDSTPLKTGQYAIIINARGEGLDETGALPVDVIENDAGKTITPLKGQADSHQTPLAATEESEQKLEQ